jgi:hypothetical protein
MPIAISRPFAAGEMAGSAFCACPGDCVPPFVGTGVESEGTPGTPANPDGFVGGTIVKVSGSGVNVRRTVVVS